MKKFYEIGTADLKPNGEWGDEHAEYMGFDKVKAFEAWQEQKFLYGKEKQCEVFGKVYDVADELNEDDIDEILEYVMNECLGWNELEDIVGGLLVRETRLRNGLTQNQTANLVGMPLRTLENWETDKRTPALWIAKLVIEKIEAHMQERVEDFNKI